MDRSGLPAAVVLVVVAAGVCIAVAGLAFTALLDAVREGDGAAALDPDIHRWVVEHRSTTLDDVFRAVTWLGSATVLVPVVLTVLVVLWWRRHPLIALGVVIACTGTLLTVLIVKPIVGRARPPLADRIAGAQGAAFPSGHSANVVAAFGILAWAATRFVHRRWQRITIWVVAATRGLLRRRLARVPGRALAVRRAQRLVRRRGVGGRRHRDRDARARTRPPPQPAALSSRAP